MKPEPLTVDPEPLLAALTLSFRVRFRRAHWLDFRLLVGRRLVAAGAWLIGCRWEMTAGPPPPSAEDLARAQVEAGRLYAQRWRPAEIDRDAFLRP